MHSEIAEATVASVLNLRNVLQLVVNRLDNGALAQQEFVSQVHQAVLHVGTQLGDQLDTLRPQALKQRLGPIPFVAKQLAEETFSQITDGLSVIDIARREATSE